MRERNEALDCRLYARAAAWIAGADGQTECGNLEQQINAQEFTEPIGPRRCRRDPTEAATLRPAGISVELSGMMASNV